MKPQTPPTEPRATRPQSQPQPQQDQGADPALQGEGNYTAARRHRESAEQFVESGRVEPAAQQAAPKDPTEQRELQQAEEAGRARARS